MRRVFAALIVGFVAIACTDRSSPTENRTGPEFKVGGGGGGAPLRFVTSGLGADAAWDFEDAVLGSYGSVYLFANQVDSLWLHGTAIYWYIQTCDQTWACSYGSGYGTLPSSVLVRKSDRTVQLAFDPADYPADVLSVVGDPLGPVDITWTKDGSYSSSSSGTSEYRTRGYSFRTHGTYDADGARPVGHATPWVVPASATGAIHANRQMEITIFR